jgi:hypothetical protein
MCAYAIDLPRERRLRTANERRNETALAVVLAELKVLGPRGFNESSFRCDRSILRVDDLARAG